MQLLPVGQRDDSAHVYLATLAPASALVATSHLRQIARMLVGLPPGTRPKRIGGRGLHLDLGRVPWSAVTVADAQRVHQAALGGARTRRTVGAMMTALKGVLRASSMPRDVLWEVERALRVDDQASTDGRSIRTLLAEWAAEDAASL